MHDEPQDEICLQFSTVCDLDSAVFLWMGEIPKGPHAGSTTHHNKNGLSKLQTTSSRPQLLQLRHCIVRGFETRRFFSNVSWRPFSDDSNHDNPVLIRTTQPQRPTEAEKRRHVMKHGSIAYHQTQILPPCDTRFCSASTRKRHDAWHDIWMSTHVLWIRFQKHEIKFQTHRQNPATSWIKQTNTSENWKQKSKATERPALRQTLTWEFLSTRHKLLGKPQHST